MTDNYIREVIEEFKDKYWTQLIDDYGDEHLYDEVIGFITSAIQMERDRIIRELGRKSVDELKEIMGDAYNDLSVQVAFKEGYNKANDTAITVVGGKE